MLYQQHELQRLALSPMRMFASNDLSVLHLPCNPVRHTPIGRVSAAMLDRFEHSTRRFGKPRFGHAEMIIGGDCVTVEDVIHADLWVDLKRFRREADRPNDRKLLIVAPLSGHFSTLLRDTVRAFLPTNVIYMTDWLDAREVPAGAPDFDPDDRVTDFLRLLGSRARHCGLPARGSGAGVGGASERGRRSVHAGKRDSARRPDRHPRGTHRRPSVRQAARHRLIRQSQFHAVGLSGFPAASRVHGRQHRAAFGSTLANVPALGARVRREPGFQARILR
jgi:hypothetical protein